MIAVILLESFLSCPAVYDLVFPLNPDNCSNDVLGGGDQRLRYSFDWQHARKNGSMSNPNTLRLVKLPSNLANQLRESVEEAFRSLGNEAAVLITYYARSRHNVAFNDLPVGIEELDNALAEILGPARRMVVNQCAEILNKRLGVETPARTEKLSDLFRQVEKQYQRTSKAVIPNSLGLGSASS